MLYHKMSSVFWMLSVSSAGPPTTDQSQRESPICRGILLLIPKSEVPIPHINMHDWSGQPVTALTHPPCSRPSLSYKSTCINDALRQKIPRTIALVWEFYFIFLCCATELPHRKINWWMAAATSASPPVPGGTL